MPIIGLCGLPGAGKTTAAEALSQGQSDANAYEYVYLPGHSSITDHIAQIVYNEPEVIDTLLRERLDPNYVDKWRTHCGNYAIRRTHREASEASEASELGKASELSVCEMFFSLAVKQITASLFGFSWELVLGTTAELREARETVRSVVSYVHCDRPTVRAALEYVGTDIFREGLDRDVWLNITMRNAQNFASSASSASRLVVISDLRFQNEAEAIVRAGGRIIQIYRKPEDLVLTDALRARHPSVWSFLEFPDELITARIQNSGTKAELADAVRAYTHA